MPNSLNVKSLRCDEQALLFAYREMTVQGKMMLAANVTNLLAQFPTQRAQGPKLLLVVSEQKLLIRE